jgi:hypothetical protein
LAVQSTELLVRPLPEPLDMRFMTFNCRYDTPSDGIHRWANRKTGFIRAIAEQHPGDVPTKQKKKKTNIG